jgi:hypothetical protein
MARTFPTDQERVDAHTEAEAAHDYAHKQIGETELIGVLHELAAQVHWLAAETRSHRLEFIAAHAVAGGELIEGQMVGDTFVPTPDVLDKVPTDRTPAGAAELWRLKGKAGDLAFEVGSTAGYPRDVHALAIEHPKIDGLIFVTPVAWDRYTDARSHET